MDLWKVFFDTLINSHTTEAPDPNIAALRQKFEGYFTANPSKSASVRVSLMKQALLLDQFLE